MNSGAVGASSWPFSEAIHLGFAREVHGMLLVSVRSVRVVSPLCEKSQHPDYFRGNLGRAAIQTTLWIVGIRPR
jgi:hypothetical protein